jgi:hypothetical protein
MTKYKIYFGIKDNMLVEKVFGFRKVLTNEIVTYKLFNEILNAFN